MSQSSRVRVYIACSLDGFIAGPDDDLSWLPGSDASEPPVDLQSEDGALGYAELMAEVGAMLMGRRTYDVVDGFGGEWPYGERPVLVATHRPIETARANVRAVVGTIEEVVALALDAAGDKDVYLDGGALIRAAMDAHLVDELIITFVPILLGEGIPLFAGVRDRHALELVSHHRMGSMLQVRARPTPPQATNASCGGGRGDARLTT